MASKFLKTVALAATLCSVAGGSSWYQRITLQREAIAHDSAHYDPRTGAFAWGSAGIYLTGSTADDLAAAELVAKSATTIPQKKPQHRGTK